MQHRELCGSTKLLSRRPTVLSTGSAAFVPADKNEGRTPAPSWVREAVAKAAYSRCILFPCCPLAGGKDVPAPPGTHLSTTSCREGGGMAHIRMVANSCPLGDKDLLPSLLPGSPGPAGMHREREGILEATVRSGYKCHPNITHRDADPLHPSLPTLHSLGSDLDGRHCWKPSSTDPLKE